MELPIRKQPRLQGYDYSANGAYFVTMCTHHKVCLFGKRQPDAYDMVMHWVHALPLKYPNVRIEKYVIMPNHLHFILMIDGIQRACEKVPLSQMMQWFKTQTTNGYIQGVKNGLFVPFDAHLWQRSFHDHVIRTQAAYDEIWKYIDTNPLKWAEDCYHVSDG